MKMALSRGVQGSGHPYGNLIYHLKIEASGSFVVYGISLIQNKDRCVHLVFRIPMTVAVITCALKRTKYPCS
jgi:hypothetical protein